MLIYLFKNTQLNKQRTILQIEDNLNEYLQHVDPNFSIQNKENWKKINGDKITFDSFKDSFNDYEEVDYAIVQFYPFNKNQYTYFFIKKVDFNSGGNYEMTFEMDYISTFPLKNVISLDKKIRMQQGHLRQDANFYANDLLRKNAFVRQLQPTEPFELINKKYLNMLYNEKLDLIASNKGVDKWIVFSMNNEIVGQNQGRYTTKLKPTATTKEALSYPTNTQSISEDFNMFFLPLSDEDLIINIADNTTTDKDQKFNSQEFYNYWKDEAKAEWATIIDFPPVNTIYWDEVFTKLTITGESYFIKPSVDQVDGAINNVALTAGKNGYSSKNAITEYVVRDNKIIFNYEKMDDIWDLDDNNWTEEQELILNFDPFKNFEIGYFSESSGTNIIWNLNNQTFLDKHSPLHPLVRRKLTPTNFPDINFVDEIGDNFINEFAELPAYLYGDVISQTNKNLFLPLINNAWKVYNTNKASRIITDFGLPSAALATGAKLGSPIATAGFGLSIISTINKRQTIKHTPDTFKNSAIELNTELLSGFDSKTLTVHEPIATHKTRLANQFHKFGWYLFNNFFTIEKILLARSRFNFFQISVDENSDIFNKNLDVIYEDKYLQLLKNGITFWNFSKNYENFRKENIFKY